MPALSIKDTVRLILSGEIPVAYEFDQSEPYAPEADEWALDKVTLVFSPIHGKGVLGFYSITPQQIVGMERRPLGHDVIRRTRDAALDALEAHANETLDVCPAGDDRHEWYVVKFMGNPEQSFYDFASLGKYLLGLPIWDNQPWE